MLMRGVISWLAVTAACTACSGGSAAHGDPATGGAASAGAAGSSGTATAGASLGGGPGGGAGSAGTASGPSAGEDGPLPNGGRQYHGIANIVDPALVQVIEAVLRTAEPATDYAPVAQAFYALYPDEYDFLYFFLDHQLDDAEAEGAFNVVNRPAISGTGIDAPTALSKFGSNGRLKGSSGFQAAMAGDFPALAHETAHYWANYLDPALGFGHDNQVDYGPHWGLTGVYGQLGGFDPSSVVCSSPEGAKPPNCEVDPDTGYSIYQTAPFAPNTNTFLGIPYAPLELYLMGLVPKSMVPTIPVIENGNVFVLLSNAALLRAHGVGQITIDDIVARHGTRAPASEAEKHFSSAFVLVTASPAPDAALDPIVEFAQLFGGTAPANSGAMSFADHTGGLATMTTALGRRRTSSDPAPAH